MSDSPAISNVTSGANVNHDGGLLGENHILKNTIGTDVRGVVFNIVYGHQIHEPMTEETPDLPTVLPNMIASVLDQAEDTNVLNAIYNEADGDQINNLDMVPRSSTTTSSQGHSLTAGATPGTTHILTKAKKTNAEGAVFNVVCGSQYGKPAGQVILG